MPVLNASKAKRNWEVALSLLLFLMVLGVFLPALDGDFISLDDSLFVTRNPHVQRGFNRESIQWAFSNTEAANWHPLTWLSHMVDYQFFGPRPQGHHLTSVLLHSLNTLLLFLVLARMAGSMWRSLFVAACFGLHPLRVESVAWVAERKDVLCSFFSLLTLLLYERYARRSGAQSPGSKSSRAGAKSKTLEKAKTSANNATDPGAFLNRGYYTLTLLLFALGLMSKPMAVTLPLVLLLLDYWPLRRFGKKGQARFLLLEKLPFLALAAALSAITMLAQRGAGAMTTEGLPPTARVTNALVSYCRYLGTIVWPVHLSVFYPYREKWPAGAVFAAALLLVSCTALAWVFRKQKPYLLTGWLWFCIVLAPVIGIVQVGAQSIADRYTYLPTIGVLILLTWGACDLSKNLRHRTLGLSLAAALILGLCAGLTRQQLRFWKDSETLFRHAIAVTRDNWLAHCNLGIWLNHRGDLAEAVAEFRLSVNSNPNYAVARQNLGAALLVQGALEQAIIELKEAVALKPDYALAHCNLGAALKRANRLDEAIIQFQEAIKYQPDDAESHYDLGFTLRTSGRLDEAIAQFREALRCDPAFTKAAENLQSALQQKNARGP